MPAFNGGSNPMVDAINDGFGAIVRDAVSDAVAPLTERIAALESQQAQLLAIIEQAKTNGGFVAKMLLNKG